MAFTISLGSSIQSQGSNLSLTLDASAVITPSEALNDRGIEKITELIHSGEAWVTQAPELALRLFIIDEPELSCPASTFSSKLGQIFCNSKLWSDLGLAILFKSCDHVVEPDQSVSFQLSFGLRRHTRPSTSKNLRIPTAMRCFSDAIPPANIPLFSLSALNVSLEYSYSPEDAESHTPYNFRIREASDAVQFLSKIANSSHEIAEQDILDHHSCFDIGTFSLSTLMEPQELKEEWISSHRIPINDDILHTDKTSVDYITEFQKLFDTTFRELLVNGPPKANKSVQENADNNTQCLSKTFPTIFSRGYREALNQRSQFIPSIAKSLTSIIEKTNNPTLHQKLTALSTPFQSTNPPQTPNPRNILKTSLWRIAQKQLYNPKASQKLSPLNSASIYEKHTIENSLLASSTGEVEDTNPHDINDLDSDCYLGTEGDDFEWDIEIDEEDTIISLPDESNLSDMLDDNDYGSDCNWIETQDTTLASENIHLKVCPSPILFQEPMQQSMGDCEMLTSDPVDVDMSSPILSSSASMIDDGGYHEDELDDMLCDQ